MKGYFKNPAATANMIDDDGWLHTGDVAKYDAEKRFYIVDRLKELIKVAKYGFIKHNIEKKSLRIS